MDPHELSSNESYEVWGGGGKGGGEKKKKKIEKYSRICGPACQWRVTAWRLQLLKQSYRCVPVC